MTQAPVSAQRPAGAANTALAPFKDVQEALAPYGTDQYHHLVPTARMERSPLFRPVIAIVKVNPADEREVYATPGSGGTTVCLHTQTPEKIGNALGIDWLGTRFERDPKEPFVVTAHVSAEYIDAVGQRRRISASATSDLRDGSVTAEVLKGGIKTARQFISERSEARARNRVVKKVTGMPTSFTKAELAKPFVALRWRLDENEPDVRRAIIAQSVGASDQIFGHAALPAGDPIDAGHAGAEEEALEGEFKPAPSGEEAAPRPTASASSAPTDDEPGIGAAPAAEPTEDELAAQVARMDAIYRGYQTARENLAFNGKPWTNAARTKQVTPQQWQLVGRSLIDAIAVPGLSDPHQRAVRHALVGFLRGPIAVWSEVTNEQASAAIEWAKEKPAEVREVFDFLVARQEALAGVREQLASQLKLGQAA